MFVQVVHARTDDPGAVSAAVKRWHDAISPGATGWLGSTGGVTDKGDLIVVVRFESAEAAAANSERSEQNEWWESLSAHLSDVEFHDCMEVDTMLAGGSDDAGFVQVMEGSSADPQRLASLGKELESSLREGRPEVIGGIVAWHGDGGFTQAIYFTSEQEARRSEAQEPPAEVAGRLKEMFSLMGEITYYDLTNPTLLSPQ